MRYYSSTEAALLEEMSVFWQCVIADLGQMLLW